MNVRLYVWQRLTAALMVPLVLVHVAVIFYATRKGMSAADILARTRGSIVWASFYGLFVAAAAIHAAIGLRNVLDRMVAARTIASPAIWSAAVFGILAAGARPAGGRRGGAVMTARRLNHRTNGCGSRRWCIGSPAWRSRIFLPLHFLTLGLAIEAKRSSTASCAGPISRW